MTSLIIRPMERRDAAAASSLFAQLTGQPPLGEADVLARLEWVNSSPIDWLFVAELDGQVRGLMGFRLRENVEHPSRYGEVSVLVVDVLARQQGIGRALMAQAEEMAHQHGCMGAWLVSGFAREAEAHRFYESLGYKTTGYRFVKRFDSPA